MENSGPTTLKLVFESLSQGCRSPLVVLLHDVEASGYSHFRLSVVLILKQAFKKFYNSLPTDEERETYAKRAIESNRFLKDFFNKSQKQGNFQKAARYKRDAMLLLWEQEHATTA